MINLDVLNINCVVAHDMYKDYKIVDVKDFDTWKHRYHLIINIVFKLSILLIKELRFKDEK